MFLLWPFFSPDGAAEVVDMLATGMGVAVPALVAGATEALGSDRAGIAAAVNNTARQVGGAIGVALIGGFAAVSTALAASDAALVLGGTAALALMRPHDCDRPEQTVSDQRHSAYA